MPDVSVAANESNGTTAVANAGTVTFNDLGVQDACQGRRGLRPLHVEAEVAAPRSEGRVTDPPRGPANHRVRPARDTRGRTLESLGGLAHHSEIEE